MKKNNIDFIVFALKQMKEAQKFGFTANECNRNLKLALNHYWQAKELGIHVFIKHKLRRTKAAYKTSLKNTIVEHTVPTQVIVNMLLKIKKIENKKVKRILKKYWQVMLVTKKEHLKLNSKKLDLTYRMPENWNKKDLFARYKLAKIKF